MNNSAPLALLDKSLIKDLIYEVRGQKVKLDFDLARIYGYGTSAFNQQIKRSLDRSPPRLLFSINKARVWAHLAITFFDLYAHDRFAVQKFHIK